MHPVYEAVAATHHRESTHIAIEGPAELPTTASKFGGTPYLPQGVEVPTDAEGRQLALLAQINCAELPANSMFPDHGMLQLWALQDELTGIDFDDLTSNARSRVTYIEEVAPLEASEVAGRYNPFAEDDGFRHFPQELKISFKRVEDGITATDYRFNDAFVAEWNAANPDDEIEEFDELENEIWDPIYEESFGEDDALHKLGGYPLFAQDDPREDAYEDYELLLQIDSESCDDAERGTWDIMWGDVGVLNFFIRPTDLAKLDFSEVLYTWDCS